MVLPLALPALGGLLGAGSSAAAMIGVGGALGATALSYNLNRRGQRAQNDFAAWQSSTQHQRAVADMRAAGLNPILAAGNPNAAASGGGLSPAHVENPAEAGFAASAKALEMDNLKSTNTLIGEQAVAASASAKAAESQAALNAQLERESAARIPFISQQTRESAERTRREKHTADTTQLPATLADKATEGVRNVIGGLESSGRGIGRRLAEWQAKRDKEARDLEWKRKTAKPIKRRYR